MFSVSAPAVQYSASWVNCADVARSFSAFRDWLHFYVFNCRCRVIVTPSVKARGSASIVFNLFSPILERNGNNKEWFDHLCRTGDSHYFGNRRRQ